MKSYKFEFDLYFVYRSIFFIAGIMILTLGIGLMYEAESLSVGAYDAFNMGLTQKFGHTVGFWTYVGGILMVTLDAIIRKGMPRFLAFVAMMFIGFFVDFWMSILERFQPQTVSGEVVTWVAGLILLALGIATYLRPKFTPAPPECILESASETFNLSIRMTKTIMESTFFISALIIGGPIGVATILVTFSLGPIIQFFQPIVSKVYGKLVVEAETAEQNNIKEIRELSGVTLDDMAKVIGINRATVSKWEVGDIRASDSDLEKLSLFFGIESQIFYSEEPLTDAYKAKIKKDSKREKLLTTRKKMLAESSGETANAAKDFVTESEAFYSEKPMTDEFKKLPEVEEVATGRNIRTASMAKDFVTEPEVFYSERPMTVEREKVSEVERMTTGRNVRTVRAENMIKDLSFESNKTSERNIGDTSMAKERNDFLENASFDAAVRKYMNSMRFILALQDEGKVEQLEIALEINKKMGQRLERTIQLRKAENDDSKSLHELINELDKML